MCDRTDCDDASTWLMQATFTPPKLDGSVNVDVEAAYCHYHMADALRGQAEALLTTSRHITIHRTQ